MLAMMPSSRTISMSTTMMTRKPMALVSRASVPGTNRATKASRAACSGDAPARTARAQALVICTAWLTPMVKMR